MSILDYSFIFKHSAIKEILRKLLNLAHIFDKKGPAHC